MTTVACVGLAVLDVVLGVDRLPTSPGKNFARSLDEVGGGPAANAAVTVARQGGTALFLGRVGDDRWGRTILADLESEGVDVTGTETVPDAPSPVSVVLVDPGGERMIVNRTDPALHAGHPPPAQALTGVDVVLVDSRWPGGAAAALRVADETGLPSVVDADRTDDPAGLAHLLPHATHVIFSRDGLVDVSGVADPGQGLEKIRGATTAWLAVTLGETGVLILDGTRESLVPAYDVDAVDTLGAGDVFHGAFALAIGEGMGEDRAVLQAAAAAALKCTRFGGRAGIPVREEVDRFMKERDGWN